MEAVAFTAVQNHCRLTIAYILWQYVYIKLCSCNKPWLPQHPWHITRTVLKTTGCQLDCCYVYNWSCRKQDSLFTYSLNKKQTQKFSNHQHSTSLLKTLHSNAFWTRSCSDLCRCVDVCFRWLNCDSRLTANQGRICHFCRGRYSHQQQRLVPTHGKLHRCGCLAHSKPLNTSSLVPGNLLVLQQQTHQPTTITHSGNN